MRKKPRKRGKRRLYEHEDTKVNAKFQHLRTLFLGHRACGVKASLILFLNFYKKKILFLNEKNYFIIFISFFFNILNTRIKGWFCYDEITLHGRWQCDTFSPLLFHFPFVLACLCHQSPTLFCFDAPPHSLLSLILTLINQ